MLAVLAIVLTAPLGAVLIATLGPRWLDVAPDDNGGGDGDAADAPKAARPPAPAGVEVDAEVELAVGAPGGASGGDSGGGPTA